MKKLGLITLVLFMSMFTTVTTYAQGEGKSSRIRFGVKAGANLSTISNGSNINFSPSMNTNIHAGVLANFHFGIRESGADAGTGFFGFQPELLYSSQGFAVDGEKVNFSYVTLPLMAKFYILKAKRKNNFLSLEVGPYFSYLLSTSPESTVISNTQIGIGDLEGGMDVGIGAGIGYEFDFGLTIGARYNFGLIEMNDNLPWKNNVTTISIGWLF